MKYSLLITEYYESDKEYPVKVVDIKPFADYGKGYYEVFCKNDEGEFADIVCIHNDMVVVIPGWIDYLEIDEETDERILSLDAPNDVKKAYEEHLRWRQSYIDKEMRIPK